MSCLFCLPAYGMWVTSHYAKSLVELVKYLEFNKFDYDITFGADSGVHRCRYFLTETFMRSGADRLMFIDADIQFNAEDFGKLWALDADIAVGVYRMHKDEPYAAHVGGELLTELPEEPIEVDYAGTGFMLIKRHVFEALAEDLPMIETKMGKHPRWWAFEVVDGIELPEDYSFCKRARDKGFKVVMDPSIKLKHWKQIGV